MGIKYLLANRPRILRPRRIRLAINNKTNTIIHQKRKMVVTAVVLTMRVKVTFNCSCQPSMCGLYNGTRPCRDICEQHI